jgi:hypothetical protein
MKAKLAIISAVLLAFAAVAQAGTITTFSGQEMVRQLAAHSQIPSRLRLSS